MTDPLIPALVGGAITIGGWFATYLYTRRIEDRRRRLEAHLQYRGQQIELLYGPLASLVEQIHTVWRVRKNILDHCGSSPDQAREARELIWKQFFAPLHTAMTGLLSTRLYLVEGGTPPPSFRLYLQHSTQEQCLHTLRDNLRLDTSRVPSQPWPKELQSDIETTLHALMEDRRLGLAKLR